MVMGNQINTYNGKLRDKKYFSYTGINNNAIIMEV